MSEPHDPQDPDKQRPDKQGPKKQGPKKPERPTMARIAVWVVAGGIGLYLVISGLIGVLSGGQ